MIICLCTSLSTRDLERFAKEGVTSVEEISKKTGAGTVCGACLEELRELVQKKSKSEPGGRG